jgi:YhcH/YjgK/YiaL family protein
MIVCPWKDLSRYADVIPGLEEAINFVNGMESYEPATYPLSGGNKVLAQLVTTKPWEGAQLEAHRQFLDIQYILEGGETVGWAPVETLELSGEFNTTKDKGMYAGHCDFMDIAEGYCYVVYPEDAHMPGSHLEVPQNYQKVVVKLKV